MTTMIMIRGGGCHGAVIYEQIQCFCFENRLEVMVWDDADAVHPTLTHLPRFWPDRAQECLAGVAQIHCYVAVGDGVVRAQLVKIMEDMFPDVIFPTLVHPKAVISPTSVIGRGCYIGPFALVNTNSVVGDFCIINSCAVVEHDCLLGCYVTVNPKGLLLGATYVGSGVTIGGNASVRDHCFVESGTLIGMGAVVTQDVHLLPKPSFWGGVPARPISVHPCLPKPCPRVSKTLARWCARKHFSQERIFMYLQSSLEAGVMTNDGPLQPLVASKIKSFVQCRNEVLMACSGTGALHALVQGLAIKEGRRLRWVTQAFTFPSSIQGPLVDALVYDMDRTLRGPCMKSLQRQVDEYDGVIVTNVFGLQSEILEYEYHCKHAGKLLVFDNAACPIGFLEDGRSIHDVGDGAIISFHETKPLGRGEGGAILTSPENRRFAHMAMNFGFDIPNNLRIPNRQCSNWRMSDFAAAAICDHLDWVVESKFQERMEWLIYFAVEQLKAKNLEIAFPIKYPTILSCLFVRLHGRNGEEICRQLNAVGIEAKHYYTPLVASKEDAPEAWHIFDTTVCLPFHSDICEADIRLMIDALCDMVQRS